MVPQLSSPEQLPTSTFTTEGDMREAEDGIVGRKHKLLSSGTHHRRTRRGGGGGERRQGLKGGMIEQGKQREKPRMIGKLPPHSCSFYLWY